ncbi:MAG: hypothetical protein JNL41_01085 [Phenylobacterium sp.]|uniref:hypothetical protein n=1 Tax=Phenylobacterium sp. TaxID=1871053 RepID=UPI001A58656C|nr:hypothetical protein [Phenylobacterium sp.]MBL8552841.1 hypothetical protein [Phenylobacterium sp.]
MSYVGGSLKMMEINRTHILKGQVAFQTIDTNDYARILNAAQLIEAAGQQLKMSSTIVAARRAQSALQAGFRGIGRYDAESLGPLISALTQMLTSFVDELGGQHIVGMDAVRGALLLADGPPLGHRVAAAFPDIQEDLSEAAACRALERPTASVFHLMRAMEAAVQALAAQLGIEGVTREWGKLLSDMKREIEVMPKGKARNAWSENHSLLYHVKQAWRNDVMHPNRTYTLAEADRIHDAVASYLEQLAELLATARTSAPEGAA